MNRAMDEFVASGASGRRGSFLPILADIYLRNGDNGAALDALDIACSVIADSGERTAESEIYLMRGLELKNAGASDEEVTRILKKATDMAKADGASILEARAGCLLNKI